MKKAFCQIYAQWDQVGQLIEDESSHLLALGLLCDATFSMDAGPMRLLPLRRIADLGGLCAPNLYPASLDPACHDPNWWKYSEEECVRLLRIAAARYEAFGLGRMQAINTYTAGNSLVAACRRVGVEFILGFCAPTIIEDGEWEIAHYGAPLSPYFVGGEDYRKPEAPGARRDGVFMASMELRNPLVSLNHWNEGPWCPLNAQAADRWLEPTEEPLPFFQIAEDWLRQAELSDETKFFHLNLQYFFAGRCREHNRRALEWLARQRAAGRLEIGGLRAWRDRLRTAGGFQEQVTYWRGEMMGFHVGHRPGCFPDVIVQESIDAQRIWRRSEPLPVRFYDYKKPWSYPAFQPDGTAPASSEFPGIEVRVGSAAVEIQNDGEPRELPLMLWDVCRQLAAPVCVAGEGWRARLIPHPTGIGAAVLLEGVAATGRTVVPFTVHGDRTSEIFSRSWDGLVEAQTFFRDGRPYTVLVAQTPECFAVEVSLRNKGGTSPVPTEHLTGIHYARNSLNGQPLRLTFDATHLVCWHRLWDVTADEIVVDGTAEACRQLRAKTTKAVREHHPSLEIPEPGFQLFGNIRDRNRWDRHLARAAGGKELQKANEWFRHLRPKEGETVVEVHPGIYLPRGSINKVLGHEFDVVRCASGVSFREMCADYPQGWDWGVAAWVQWRHLAVSVSGLKGARFNLHLHAFDPEKRGIVQQVYLFDPRDAKRRRDRCLINGWTLPGGTDQRFDPRALCSADIPEDCLAWPAVGIWIVPQAREKLYDWVEERGAPGLFSHLWITRAR